MSTNATTYATAAAPQAVGDTNEIITPTKVIVVVLVVVLIIVCAGGAFIILRKRSPKLDKYELDMSSNDVAQPLNNSPFGDSNGSPTQFAKYDDGQPRSQSVPQLTESPPPQDDNNESSQKKGDEDDDGL